MSKVFFLFFQEYFSFGNSTFAIVLESFKLNYFFLTSNTCDEYFAVGTQSGQMPETFDARLTCARTLFFFIENLSSAVSKLKFLAAKHAILQPT